MISFFKFFDFLNSQGDVIKWASQRDKATEGRKEMRVYQLSGEKEYLLPKEVYYQCIWIVRDAKRLMKVAGIPLSEQEDVRMLHESIDLARWGVNDAKVENAIFQLICIEKAAQKIPFEYREAVVRSIVERGSGCDCYANEKTWKRWRQRFIYYLAKNLALY